MSIALSEFWTRLVRSGICDADACRRVASAAAKANRGTPPSDAVTVAKFMVQRGQLTKYQARSLLADPPRELRAGDYLIRSDRAPGPFSQWVEVSRIDSGAQGVLLRVALDGQSQPLRELLELHRSVQHPSLQPLEVQFHSESVLLFSPLLPGESLLDRIAADQSWSPLEVCQLGVSLAGALQALHDRSLPHGQVRIDRVWMSEQGGGLLLRDPSLSLTGADTSHWLDSTESAALYAAPETQTASRSPNVAADIYSLGCLLFRLATGRYPYLGNNDAETLAAHHSNPPAELFEAVQRGEAGDPLFRVLAFAMAKSPAARFASADQLTSALQATASLLGKLPETGRPPKASQSDAEKQPPAPPVSPTAPPPKSPPAKPEQSPAKLKQTPAKRLEPEATPAQATVAKGPAATSPKSQGETSGESKPSSLKSSATKRPETVKQQDGPKERVSQAASGSTPSSGKPAKKEPRRKSEAEKKNADQDRSSSQQTTAEKNRERSPQPPIDSGASGESPEVAPAPMIPSDTLSDSTAQESADSVNGERAQGSVALPSQESDSSDSQTTDSIDASELPATAGQLEPTDTEEVAAPSSEVIAALNLETLDAAPADRSPATSPPRRRRKKRSKAPFVLGGLCVAVLILLIGLIAGDDSSEPDPEPRRPRSIPSVIPPVTSQADSQSGSATATAQDQAVSGYELVSDDRLLFVPPYPAESASAPLELLPPGPAVIVSARLAEIMQHPTAAILIEGISSGMESLISSAAERAKLPVDSIRRMSVALYPGEQGWPEVSLVVELDEAIEADELIEKLGVAPARTRENQTIYVGDDEDGDAYYWQEDQGESIARYAVGSIERISEVASLGGGAIPLPRSSQALWAGASAESELVVLFTPNFLFADGRELLVSATPELVPALKRFTQPDVSVGLISVKFCDSDLVFVEARFAPSGGISEAALMRKVTETIQAWPDWADQFILESVQDPSWRLLASRLPSMMRFVVAQTRFGISDGAVIANAYLPADAFPQVTLASLMAMNTPSTAGSTPMVAESLEVLTIEQMLERPMTVSFDQESLEFALESIVNAFRDGLPPGNEMPGARIIGGDLELMGITQNQQVRDFSKTDEPLRAVLTDLVVRANPDKSATGPNDAKQALIWVVADDAANSGQKEILITTRQAAKSNNYELPKEFQLDGQQQ